MRNSLNGPGERKGGNSKQAKPSPVANANDVMVFWPLFCYELQLSVDQEDRMLQAYKG